MDLFSGAISRRGLFALGGAAASGCVAARALRAQTASGHSAYRSAPGALEGFDRIEQILGAEGKMEHGVFSVAIDRKDIQNVTLKGVPIKPAFQLDADIYFQSLGNGRVILNADYPLKADELNPFIDQLLANNLVFQAQHQHLFNFSPMVWFIHFRAMGETEPVARGLKAALNVTSTPFPQNSPQSPTTPLPADVLGQIIGALPSVKDDGVVSFEVPRTEQVTLGGIAVSPYLNLAAPISFQPYGGGQNAAAVVDFGMLASEVMGVMKVMRERKWEIGCLYNQETDQQPQLYFSHQFKTGDSLQLAREIRDGLNQTNSKSV